MTAAEFAIMAFAASNCCVKVWVGKKSSQYEIIIRAGGEFASELLIPADATKLRFVKKGNKYMLINWRDFSLPKLREIRGSPSILFAEPEKMLATVAKAHISVLSNFFILPDNVKEGQIASHSTMYNCVFVLNGLGAARHVCIDRPINTIFYRDWKPHKRTGDDITVETEDTLFRFPVQDYRAEDIIPANKKLVVVYYKMTTHTIDFTDYRGDMLYFFANGVSIEGIDFFSQLVKFKARVLVKGWMVLPPIEAKGEIALVGKDNGCVDVSQLKLSYYSADLLYIKHPSGAKFSGSAKVEEIDGEICYENTLYDLAEFEAAHPDLVKMIGHPPRFKPACE